MDADNGDYRLRPESPAIGNGKPLADGADAPNIGASTELLVIDKTKAYISDRSARHISQCDDSQG